MRVTTRSLILSALFAALVAAGAFVRFPLPPFPGMITMQLFFVMLCAFALPPLPAFLSVFAYIALGLAGVPVLSMGGGPQYVLQPTFGYLLGFLAGAPAASAVWRAERLKDRPPLRNVLAGTALLACTYALGAPYMGFILNVVKGTGMPWGKVALVGCVMFIPVDAAKIALAAMAARGLERVTGLRMR